MEAAIITIGDEILIGQIIDSNSAWIGEQLNDYGINVAEIRSISDRVEVITETLRELESRYPIVLVTGGLGPTKDDLTKECVAEYYGSELVLNRDVLDHITELLGSRSIEITPTNFDQAKVPACCTVVPNRLGTAPVMWFDRDGGVSAFMPGVPHEMKCVMSEELLPKFRELYGLSSNFHYTVQTQGIAESILAESIDHWIVTLPEEVKVAYLPSSSGVMIRFSLYGDFSDKQKDDLILKIKELNHLIPKFKYGSGDCSLSQVLGSNLSSLGLTVSTAESCTGGAIAAEFVSNRSSSTYFKGSLVAYSNEIKSAVLGVDRGVIDRFGAVSEEVVVQMAKGARTMFKTDYSIAVSGIAGPDGGTADKPVGSVWIAVATPNKVYSKLFRFGSDRQRNITRTTQTALNMLRQINLSIYDPE